MGKNLIKVALFGLGRIGLMHAENLINNKNFIIKYVYDENSILTKKISKKINCIGIDDPKIAFGDIEINCIYISTSTPSHLKFIYEAVKKNKSIFCEKPLDINLKKVLSYEKKIKNFNNKIQLRFNRRYDKKLKRLRSELTKGKIGKLEKIIITSRDPSPASSKYLKSSGGIFRDMMIHDFDLARFYAGNDRFVSIFATGSNVANKKFNNYNDFENATSILKTKSGVICIIINSRHCSFGYDQRVELFGSKGIMFCNNPANEKIIYPKKTFKLIDKSKYFFIKRYDKAYKEQLNDLADYIKNNKKPLANFYDGKISLLIAEHAMKSIKSKKLQKILY